MTPEIKQRIEQIRCGEVPVGYKKTKVGIVPNEWKETKLSNYLMVNNEKNINLKYGKEDVFSISGELGIVNQIQLLGRSYAGASVAPYGVVYPNDIVYTKSPLKANPYGIIKTNKTGAIGIVSTLYAIFHCKDNVCPDFVQLYFELDQNLNNYLYPIVNIGAKHDMKISDENSLKGWVVFPPLNEQEKIVEILSIQDKLIVLKEKMIEEKKSQKKALMQQLLTGRKRMPGFNKEWEKIKFKATGITIKKGQTITQKDALGGTIPVIAGGKTPAYYCNKANRHGWTITVSASGASAGYVNMYKEDIFASDCSTIEEGASYDIVFVYNLLLNIQKDIYAAQTGGAQPHIHPSDLYSLQICYSYDLEEQKAIANVLSSCDNEIDLLLQELDQEKQKKKALMQLLLSGIVRVK